MSQEAGGKPDNTANNKRHYREIGQASAPNAAREGGNDNRQQGDNRAPRSQAGGRTGQGNQPPRNRKPRNRRPVQSRTQQGGPVERAADSKNTVQKSAQNNSQSNNQGNNQSGSQNTSQNRNQNTAQNNNQNNFQSSRKNRPAAKRNDIRQTASGEPQADGVVLKKQNAVAEKKPLRNDKNLRSNRPRWEKRVKAEENYDDIRRDIERIEKEIWLEIASIHTIKLDF